MIGSARRQRFVGVVVDEQAPDLLEVEPADQLLDVDAAVAQRAAVAVGLGDFGGEGEYSLQAILDFHRCHPSRCVGSVSASVCVGCGSNFLQLLKKIRPAGMVCQH